MSRSFYFAKYYYHRQTPAARAYRLYRGALVSWMIAFVVGSSPAQIQQSVDDSTPGNVVIAWNQVLLNTIAATRTPPTIAARALAIIQTAAFNAWTAYTPNAESTERETPSRRPQEERTVHNKELAISYAAYRALTDLFPSQVQTFLTTAQQYHVDPYDYTMDPSTPIGVGNVAAAAVLINRHKDGSNQLGDLHPGAYSDYTSYVLVNTPQHIVDPDRWQPLAVQTVNGLAAQSFVTPQWGKVKPFADVVLQPSQGPIRYTTDPHGYARQAGDLVRLSAQLTDEQKMVAEYWALGPGTTTPPGRWFEFAQFVSKRDHHSVDDDAQLFFVLGNAMLDSSIACWKAKRTYDSERPITAVHFLYSGRLIEAWAGPGLGTRFIDGSEWQPYQMAVSPTPAFPEYFSGHSTFSAAAAEILTLWTGTPRFGVSYTAQAGSSLIEPGVTPESTIQLEWKTFHEAADQAGLSRRYGGIHFQQGDLEGRDLGKLIGQAVWERSQRFLQDDLNDDHNETQH